MRVTDQAGYVLHTRPYRESSLLIDLFTREHGRVTVLAKGVRRLKSRQRSALVPFSQLSLSWSGRGELPVLTQSEHDGPVLLLRGQDRLCAFYANELLTRLLHRHDPHARLFDAYRDLLEGLGSGDHAEKNLRLFEKILLKEIGYALELEHEADGITKVDPDAGYQYVPAYGVVRAESNDSNALTVRGATLIALAREELDASCLVECKQFMRSVLSHHLGPYKLHTRSLFKVY